VVVVAVVSAVKGFMLLMDFVGLVLISVIDVVRPLFVLSVV